MQLINVVSEITQLHTEIEVYLTKSLENGLIIGEKLAQAKKSLPHGQFTGWVKDNLPFTPRTARNYIKLHENRAQLEGAEVSSLGEAYKLLREPSKTETVSVLREHERAELAELEDKMKRLLPHAMKYMDMVEAQKKRLQVTMSENGVSSLFPKSGEIVLLWATKTLDPAMDKEEGAIAEMEIKRVHDQYIDVKIRRTSGEYGYEIYNKRGGIMINDDLDLFMLIFSDIFSFDDMIGMEVREAA